MFKPLQPCFEVTISSSFQIHEVTWHLSSWNYAFKEWKAKEIQYGSTEQTSKLANADLNPHMHLHQNHLLSTNSSFMV
jgi:hypothetical protein